jgi:2'-5' RNA ligase
LLPPFHWPQSDEQILKTAVDEAAHGRDSFGIQVDGFGAFAPRVIYAHVKPSRPLDTLRSELLKSGMQLGIVQSEQLKPFRPHITLAFRDLSPGMFAKAWAEVEARPLHFSFLSQHIALLRHTGAGWEVAYKAWY